MNIAKDVLIANIKAGTPHRCSLCTLLATHIEYIHDHEFFFCEDHQDHLEKKKGE